MPVPSSVFSVLLLTADAGVQAQIKQAFRDASITVVRDAAALRREMTKHQFDAVVVECNQRRDRFDASQAELNALGYYYLRAKRLREAVEVFKDVDRRFRKERAPFFRQQVAEALFNQGYALGAMGNHKRAVDAYAVAASRMAGSR